MGDYRAIFLTLRSEMKFGLHRDADKSQRLKFWIGRVNIRAERWPWMTRTISALAIAPDERAGQKYGWKPTNGMGRFGGGWNWQLGVNFSSTTIMLCLLFGFIRISWYREKL